MFLQSIHAERACGPLFAVINPESLEHLIKTLKKTFEPILIDTLNYLLMEACTLVNQNDVRVKGQCHFTVFVSINFKFLIFKGVYKTFLIDVVGHHKTF